MASATVRVKGLAEFQRGLAKCNREVSRKLDRELKAAAGIVAADARSRFAGIDSGSAAGFRPRVRGFGRAFVEQSRRRTTGQHPQYGALQMRMALLPALGAKRGEVVNRLEDMLDNLLSGNF